MTETEELIAKTDALIAETSDRIRDGRRRLRQDRQLLQNLGVDLPSLKAHADAEASSARWYPLESLIAVNAVCVDAAYAVPSRRMKLRPLV